MLDFLYFTKYDVSLLFQVKMIEKKIPLCPESVLITSQHILLCMCLLLNQSSVTYKHTTSSEIESSYILAVY
jgi:hypothetical protein